MTDAPEDVLARKIDEALDHLMKARTESKEKHTKRILDKIILDLLSWS